jgi:hypothetical protein
MRCCAGFFMGTFSSFEDLLIPFTTIDTASFQKNSEYLPTYPSGRGLAILETLLAATLFALFLLAIRRQFRR